ncbi:MAG: hypothetical protein ACR2O3_04595 [Rhizobiaceae bacterium]
MTGSIRILRTTFALFFAMVVNSSTPAYSFDTGHHFDMTRIVLKRENLGTDAVNTAILANWLTDYYSTAPAAFNLLLKPALNRLHFDNLETHEEVENYYYWLMRNVRELAEEAALENDRIKMLAVIGIAHHVIQDFYSHSNWSELYDRQPNGDFDVDLFPRITARLKGKLRTGSWPEQGKYAHGDYFRGINKDSFVRPGWENALVMAHAATVNITRKIRNWAVAVRPEFWQHLGSLNFTERNRRELMRDLKSAHDISMLVKAKVLGLPASDGHWKGNLSGNNGKFTAANNAFTTWRNSFLSRYFRESDVVPRLALNLDEPKPKGHRLLQNIHETGGSAIIVKVHSFQLAESAKGLERVGAKITINGEPYYGRIFSRDTAYDASKIPAWHEIHIEPDENAEVDILIELFAYEANRKSVELPIDINIEPGRFALYHKISKSGDLIGILKERIAGKKTEILKSYGESIYSAAISYSAEIYEIE